MEISENQIKEIAKAVVREDGFQPTKWMRAVPIMIACIALGTGSLGAYSIKALFALNNTIMIVDRLESRVNTIEKLGSPSLASHADLDDLRDRSMSERTSKVEQAIIQNTLDHGDIKSRLAAIETDVRFVKEFLLRGTSKP